MCVLLGDKRVMDFAASSIREKLRVLLAGTEFKDTVVAAKFFSQVIESKI